MTTSRPFRYDTEMVVRRSLRRVGRRLVLVGSIFEIMLLGTFVWITVRWGLEWPSVAMLLIVPMLYGGLYVLAERRLRKSLADPRNRVALDRSVQFDESQIVWSDTQGAKSQLPWSSVIGRERIETTTLIWVTAQQALFIPDSAWMPDDLPLWNARVERLNEFKP